MRKFGKDANPLNFTLCYGEDGTGKSPGPHQSSRRISPHLSSSRLISGNVCNSKNVRHFAKKIDSETKGVGLHLMMADGGASVEGRENDQEIVLKRLALCQVTTSP